jgi:RNA polymerase sigma-70 factor (ECF subfamily)
MPQTSPQHPKPGNVEPFHPDPTDGALLVAIGRQDPEAFRQFYERYAGRLMAYVQAMGRGRLPAEDLVQEIFVGVWRKAGQYRPELGTPEAWIFTITRNKVLDIWRSHLPVEVLGDLELETTLMDGTPTTDPTLVATIHKALLELPADQRRPLVLAYFGGYTYEEAAHRLGVPVGTLKSRIRMALGQLKGLLGRP